MLLMPSLALSRGLKSFAAQASTCQLTHWPNHNTHPANRKLPRCSGCVGNSWSNPNQQHARHLHTVHFPGLPASLPASCLLQCLRPHLHNRVLPLSYAKHRLFGLPSSTTCAHHSVPNMPASGSNSFRILPMQLPLTKLPSRLSVPHASK